MNAAASALLLQDGLRVAEAAHAADRENRWSEALARYQHCVGLLLRLVQTGSLTPEQDAQVRSRCAHFLDRAETLKLLLASAAATAPSSPAAVPPSPPPPPPDEVRTWRSVWRRLCVVGQDEGEAQEDELLLHSFARLEMAGDGTRRGSLFVSRHRLCFVPHAGGEKHVAAAAACFAAEEAVRLPLSQLLGCEPEAAYLGLSSRLSVTTPGGSLLFRGLGSRRDAVLEAVRTAAERRRSSLRVFGGPPGVAVPRLVAAALEERLEHAWDGPPDELLARGAAAALDVGCEPDWDTLDAPTLVLLLLSYLRETVPPLLPLDVLSSLLDPSVAARLSVLSRLPEGTRALLRFLAHLWAAADGASDATGLDAAALGRLFAPSLCRLPPADAVALRAVGDWVALLIRERRNAF